jgi:hypothetical protein
MMANRDHVLVQKVAMVNKVRVLVQKVAKGNKAHVLVQKAAKGNKAHVLGLVLPGKMAPFRVRGLLMCKNLKRQMWQRMSAKVNLSNSSLN